MARVLELTSLLVVSNLLAAGCSAQPASGIHTTRSLSPAAVAAAAGQTGPADHSVGLIQYPTLSPSGDRIVFSWLDDLWIVPAEGGVAARLTNHPAPERRSVFSPDGSLLAFESGRDGGRNIYTMPLSKGPDGATLAGETRRVHVMDRSQTLSDITPDGKYLLINSSHEPAVYRGLKMYKLPIEGGPLERLTDAHGYMPRISSDGDQIVFAYRRYDYNRPKYRGSGTSDLWSMSVPGGEFTQLTSAAGDDADGFPLADGSVIFVSSRGGQNNIWRLPAGGKDGDAVRITDFKPGGEPTIGHGVRDLTVTPDGKMAAFVVWDTLYTLDLTRSGAQPKAVTVLATSGADENDWNRTNLSREVSEAALSPDGKTIAMVARGEIFLRSTSEGRPTRRVTSTIGRERDLAWSPDNTKLYFVSDDTGVPRLYVATVELSREDLQPRKEGEPTGQAPVIEDAPVPPAPEPGVAPDPTGGDPAGAPAADPNAEPKPEPKPDPNADPAGSDPAPTEPPAADKKEGDDAEKAEKKDDKKKEEPDIGKRWADSLRFKIEPVNTGMESDDQDVRNGIFGIEISNPIPSPDGEKLLFTRGRGDLVMHTIATGENRVLFESWDEADVQWASDNRHIVYAVADLDFQSDIYILDTGDADAKPVNVTRHPDLDDSPRLSHDGKVLYFRSERSGQNFDFDIWYVFLDKSLEAMTDYELEEYFKNAADEAKKLKPIKPKAAKADEKKSDDAEAKADDDEKAGADKKADKKPEPFKFDTDDAYLRVRRMTSTNGSESGLMITPAGDRVMFNSADGDRAYVSVSRKGDDRKTIQAGGASPHGVSVSGDKITYTARGTAYTASPATGKSDAMGIDAPVVIDVSAEQRQKFVEAARIIGNVFYHKNVKGLNWKAITDRYAQLAEQTRTPDEFERVVQMLFGELDGSHTGVNAAGGFSTAGLSTGYLGIETKPADNGVEIVSIIPNSPAALPIGGAKVALEPGDVIVAIDDQKIRGEDRTIDLATALMGRAGKETLVELERKDSAKPRFVLLVPNSAGGDSQLRYQTEVLARAKRVEELSGGKLGYLHIRGMSMPSVLDFERDLYAAAAGKDGLIIDVRDNGGGSTADILLASLTAPNHAFTVPRGADPATVPTDSYPRDRRLIYGYNRPITVLINENSFSNAEIFAHAIKNIGRGKLVGTATYGGVISTGAASLIDGSTVRTPFRAWFTNDGTDMENNGAQPDINVPMTPAAEAKGEDPQLAAAVQELLTRASEAKTRREAVKPTYSELPK